MVDLAIWWVTEQMPLRYIRGSDQQAADVARPREDNYELRARHYVNLPPN